MGDALLGSVIIPTYKRAKLLGFVLESLTKQTKNNFEVMVVLKPSNDGTEKIIRKYKNKLDINLLIQKKGYVVDALNIGLRNVSGEVIFFLDDDAIPFRNWIEKHLKLYQAHNIGGVAGDVIPAILCNDKLLLCKNNNSEIIPNKALKVGNIKRKMFYQPLNGQEDHLIYINKGGFVTPTYEYKSGTVKTLLGMGANMSVLKKCTEDFTFPVSWQIRGIGWEQLLGWHIWKKGYPIIFDPNVKVYHLSHGQTLSRNIINKKAIYVREVERQLFFYRIYDYEKNLSKMHRIVTLLFYLFTYFKKMGENLEYLERLKGLLIGNLIGINLYIRARE